ncbi:MAG: hypothetical protein J0H79_13835 [Alphaproteobacteria bacterium]|nr:hypothetical protein [Alphaproteobacteria bacterium]OJU56925.1 MAG: hypothetical protein BGO00_09935 [Alphaproteobacteria bacterium 62-8]
MQIAIGLTLLAWASTMGVLVTINQRQFQRDGQMRSRNAAVVAGLIGLWCLLAGLWMFLGQS